MSDLKIKKFFEKITDKIKSYEEIGMAAQLCGKNSSATTGILTLTTSNQNPLVGQSNAVLYGADGTASTATTTAQSNSLFTVTPSTGKIKILKAGHYLVIASAYAYDQFTAEDRVYFGVQVNGSRPNRFTVTKRMSGNYQIIYLCQSYVAAANDELNIAVLNNTSARGRCCSNLATMLQVIRID